jgi:hypothetical protein
MRAELEARHRAKVAPAAADRPEQIGVLVRGRADDRAAREHDLRAEQVVDREPAPRREPAVAAAEREPTDAYVLPCQARAVEAGTGCGAHRCG